MKILFQYTKRMLLANKGRTAVTLAGIILSFALLTAVFTSASSLLHFMVEWEKDENGDYHGVLYQCDLQAKETLLGLEEVTETASVGLVGIAQAAESKNSLNAKHYMMVGSADEAFIRMMRIQLLEGRMPENDGEIALPQGVVKNGFSCQIGDEITLSLGWRYDGDGNLIPHQEAFLWKYNQEGKEYADETLREESTKTYRVTGVFEDPGFNQFYDPCYLLLTAQAETDRQDLYFKATDIDTALVLLRTCFADYSTGYNQEMARYLGEENADIRKLIYGLCGVLAAIIAAAATALIYNSFSISVGERTRQFGLFRSIGATRFQMMVSVFIEAGILSVTAIPLGIGIGCLGVIAVLRYLQPSFEAFLSIKGTAGTVMEFSTEPAYLIISAAVGLVTILISAALPAVRAAGISPMTAIRQHQDIREPAKHPGRFTGKGLAGRLLGTGGLLAHRNMMRNRKTYRAISFSLAVCLFLFLGGAGFVFYAEKTFSSFSGSTRYDFCLRASSFAEEGEEITRAVTERLRSSAAVKESAYVRHFYMNLEGPTSMLTEEGLCYIRQYQPDLSADTARFCVGVDLYYVDEEAYEQYLRELGLEPEEYLREENPKALVLNAVRGVMYEENDRRRFFEGSLLKGKEAFAESMVWSVKRIPEAYSYYFPDGEHITYYCGSEDSVREETLTLEEGRFVLPCEPGAFVTGEAYPFWADSSLPALVLPESQWDASLLMDSGTSVCNGYVCAADEEAVETILSELAQEYAYGLSWYRVSESRKQEEGMIRIVQVMLMCFVGLIILISVANIVNTISTSVRLRTREYAMLKAVGIGKRTLFCFILTENISYVLKALAVGSLMGLAANYAEFREIAQNIYLNSMIPVGLYVLGAAGMAVVLVFSVCYTWLKLQKGNICEELRKETL